MHMPLDVDPAVLGANISFARKKAAKTQGELAELLGVSRPTYAAIESGLRTPTELELHAIAGHLNVSTRTLLALGRPDESATVRFRALRNAGDAQAALDALEEYGRRYVRLEQLANDRIARREPTMFSLDRAISVDRIAEEVAAIERQRLGLGDGPLPDLRAVFEEDAGLKIFGLEELRRTKISGLFAYSAEYGPLVGFNVAHDARRVRWTLCHEYAHFLTERYEPEITEDSHAGRRDRREIFADAFAARFLMPATGLSRRFSDMLDDAAGGFKAVHLLMLAEYFEVSFQAVTQRLEELSRITRGTYEMLLQQGFKPLQAEQLLGVARPLIDRLPSRYLYLVASLSGKGLLSEGDVSAYLRTDRLTARELLLSVAKSSDELSEAAAGLDTPIGVAN